MKKLIRLVFILNGIFIISCIQPKNIFIETSDAYFGLTPPELIPEVFAPGIVSDSTWAEHCQVAVSPKGDEIYWSAWTTAYKTEDGTKNTEQLFYTKFINGTWTKPVITEFTANNRHGLNGGPVFSPDGSRLYFYQVKSPWMSSPMNTYYVDKINGTWVTEPVVVSDSYNFDSRNYTPVFTEKGNAYKNSTYLGKFKYNQGVFEFTDTVVIHKEFRPAWNVYVSPKEDYIIFAAMHTIGYGDVDLYISFKEQNDTWGYPINLGPEINTELRERFPVVSPDGKYLFFMRHTKTQDFFWVSTDILKEFKKLPDED